MGSTSSCLDKRANKHGSADQASTRKATEVALSPSFSELSRSRLLGPQVILRSLLKSELLKLHIIQAPSLTPFEDPGGATVLCTLLQQDAEFHAAVFQLAQLLELQLVGCLNLTLQASAHASAAPSSIRVCVTDGHPLDPQQTVPALVFQILQDQFGQLPAPSEAPTSLPSSLQPVTAHPGNMVGMPSTSCASAPSPERLMCSRLEVMLSEVPASLTLLSIPQGGMVLAQNRLSKGLFGDLEGRLKPDDSTRGMADDVQGGQGRTSTQLEEGSFLLLRRLFLLECPSRIHEMMNAVAQGRRWKGFIHVSPTFVHIAETPDAPPAAAPDDLSMNTESSQPAIRSQDMSPPSALHAPPAQRQQQQQQQQQQQHMHASCSPENAPWSPQQQLHESSEQQQQEQQLHANRRQEDVHSSLRHAEHGRSKSSTEVNTAARAHVPKSRSQESLPASNPSLHPEHAASSPGSPGSLNQEGPPMRRLNRSGSQHTPLRLSLATQSSVQDPHTGRASVGVSLGGSGQDAEPALVLEPPQKLLHLLSTSVGAQRGVLHPHHHHRHHHHHHHQQQQQQGAQQGDVETEVEVPPSSCQHHVEVWPCIDPVTQQGAIHIVQKDVTAQAELEAALSEITDAHLLILAQLYPRHVLEALSMGGSDLKQAQIASLARPHQDVTLLFLDLVSFTEMSKDIPAVDVIMFLSKLFCTFDELVSKYQLQKVDQVADAYIVAAGVVTRDTEGFRVIDPNTDPSDGAGRILALAIEMLHVTHTMLMPNKVPCKIRVGIHTGPCVSGLVGVASSVGFPKWSVYGDSVNTAARLEQTAPACCIQLSDAAKLALPVAIDSLVPSGGVQMKGKGVMHTWMFHAPSEWEAARLTGQASQLPPTFKQLHEHCSMLKVRQCCKASPPAPPDCGEVLSSRGSQHQLHDDNHHHHHHHHQQQQQQQQEDALHNRGPPSAAPCLGSEQSPALSAHHTSTCTGDALDNVHYNSSSIDSRAIMRVLAKHANSTHGQASRGAHGRRFSTPPALS